MNDRPHTTTHEVFPDPTVSGGTGPRHSAKKSSPWRSVPSAETMPLADFDFLDSSEFAQSDRVGRGLALFEGIVEPTPQQMTSVMQMNSLRLMGLNQPAGQMRREVVGSPPPRLLVRATASARGSTTTAM